LWWIAQIGFDAVRMDYAAARSAPVLEQMGRRDKTRISLTSTFWASFSTAIAALISYFQTGRRGHDGFDHAD
jgi:hypothetical protein